MISAAGINSPINILKEKSLTETNRPVKTVSKENQVKMIILKTEIHGKKYAGMNDIILFVEKNNYSFDI